MIRSVGTDIIEIGRVREFADRGERYLRRVFTPTEVETAHARGMSAAFLAGRFAAKEAIAKCLGPPLKWSDVEVLSREDGKPEAVLHGRAAEIARGAVVHVSISHGRDYAVAVAILEMPDTGREDAR